MSRRKSLEFSGCVQIEGEEDGYDALTGLPDRTTLERRIERCLAQKGRPFSLIVIAIDNFRSFNDAYGYAVGDAIIARFGRYLQTSLSTGVEMVGRVGSEEYLAIVDGADRDVLDGLTSDLLSVRLTIDGEGPSGESTSVSLTAGAGVVSWDGEAALTPAALIRQAEVALRKAKQDRLGKAVLVMSDVAESGAGAPEQVAAAEENDGSPYRTPCAAGTMVSANPNAPDPGRAAGVVGAVRLLLNDVVAVETMDEAVRMVHDGGWAQAITRDGEVVNPVGAVGGSSLSQSDLSLAARRDKALKRITVLQGQLDDIERKIAQVIAQFDKQACYLQVNNYLSKFSAEMRWDLSKLNSMVESIDALPDGSEKEARRKEFAENLYSNPRYQVCGRYVYDMAGVLGNEIMQCYTGTNKNLFGAFDELMVLSYKWEHHGYEMRANFQSSVLSNFMALVNYSTFCLNEHYLAIKDDPEKKTELAEWLGFWKGLFGTAPLPETALTLLADDDDADQQNQQKFRPQMQVLPERLKLTHGGLPFLYLLYL